jgi:Fic family protein
MFSKAHGQAGRAFFWYIGQSPALCPSRYCVFRLFSYFCPTVTQMKDMEEENIWQTIEEETKLYDSLRLSDEVDYEKFYLYSLITHSTAIEGSTLTELDTQLLFDEGITAKGKPLVHHLMNEDLRQAYLYVIDKAKEQTPFSPAFLKELNALVMRTTGSVKQVIAGMFDSSKGDYRLCGVTAGYGGKSYTNYAKVPDKVEALCKELNKRLGECKTLKEKYCLSFEAHLNLVTIHPWVDGNGRTSRLLMNYLQFYYQIIPAKIYKEDKAEYITSLIESREQEDSAPFLAFMEKQLLKMLREEIKNYRDGEEKDTKLMF